MTAVDGNDVTAGVLALLNVAPSANALQHEDIKAAPPMTDYVEVGAVPREGGAPSRLDGVVMSDSWRITVRVVGRYESNAYTLMARCRTRLEHVLLAAGSISGQVSRVESADPIAPDDGWWSSLMTFTVTF